MSKRFLIILAVIFAVFVGFIVISKNKQDSSSGGGNQASNNVIGKGEKGVTLVEYGDFQCPYCAQYYSVLKQIKAKYGDDITFQFRNFPLTQIHQNAMAAHRSAEAAAKQNKFWEMHDLLYERQAAWSEQKNVDQVFEDYATELGLNVEQYRQDFASAEVNAIINADIAEGNSLGISSTPTFVINGKKVDNIAPSVDAFTTIIDQAIKENSSS